ncbi:MAG TPA: exo-beta-N-acetylmuramidase NamZ domain-containing protein [Pyrinomonadaceae bacterium]|nr:exo-beta-N-acetylmuramidase NamZ domain-containing protein [Pyrinomonadaceae bacterium]
MTFPSLLNRISALACLLVFLSQAFSQQLPIAPAAAAGISAERLGRMDAVITASIEKKELPGAVVLVARHGKIVWRKAYGARAVEPQREAMTLDTIFDLASLTKVVATTTSIMMLVEEGKIRLADPVTQFIPEMKGEGRDAITIEHLMTHVSGFAPDFDLRERWTGYDEAIKHLYREPLRTPPGMRFVYSDINYIALGEVVHRVSGLMLDEFARRNVFAPLGMRDTGFNPNSSLRARIAPTEKRRGQMNYLGDSGANAGAEGEQWLRGQVHDPTSFRMGGVAGHAGLFSTANDLAIFCQMLLNGGVYNGVRILSPMTIATMTRPRAVSETGAARGLGWDLATTFSSNKGDLFPLGSFGHTGFTGTSIWIDPAGDSFVIFLSNRVHPDGKGDVGPLRGRVASIVASSITDTTASKAREESANTAAELLVSLARLNTNANRASSTAVTPADAQVLTGIDVLERDGFKQLANLRIGLVTNQTGRDRTGNSTIDVLFKAPNVKLVALFSPEHGIRGLSDEKVSDTKDEQTGLPIYSLYGESRRPKPEQLKDLDALVYDIQDVGARFYTYISTLGNVIEEAGKAKLPIFILDRPNPINGVDVEGPIADADKLSFTAYHTIPVRHGMTVGELARLYNDDKKLGADVRVIQMENWRRAMWFDSTNLSWINPSPNMRSLTEAALYPGIGLLETTNVSVGRGTDTPFEVVGAPWLDGQKLASYLNARRIPGVRFIPIRFKPNTSVFKNEECSGVNVVITDRSNFRSVRTGIEVAVALHRLYPAEWKVDSYSRLLVNADALEKLKRGASPEELTQSWSGPLENFQKTRAKVLLYQ